MTCMIPATISKFESSDKQIFESIYFQSIHFSSQILDTYFCCACNGLFNDHQSLSTHIYSDHVYTVEYYFFLLRPLGLLLVFYIVQYCTIYTLSTHTMSLILYYNNTLCRKYLTELRIFAVLPDLH